MKNRKMKRPPGANRRASNSTATVLDRPEHSGARDALQLMRRHWLARRGVAEPLLTALLDVAFPSQNREVR